MSKSSENKRNLKLDSHLIVYCVIKLNVVKNEN